MKDYVPSSDAYEIKEVSPPIEKGKKKKKVVQRLEDKLKESEKIKEPEDELIFTMEPTYFPKQTPLFEIIQVKFF